MAKPTAQACHAMTTYYIGRYEAEYGEKPTVNRNKARYLFEALLMDYDKSEVQALVDFYIKHFEPSIDWFQWNYEKVVEAKAEYEKERRLISQRRAETARRLEEWKKRKQEWKKS